MSALVDLHEVSFERLPKCTDARFKRHLVVYASIVDQNIDFPDFVPYPGKCVETLLLVRQFNLHDMDGSSHCMQTRDKLVGLRTSSCRDYHRGALFGKCLANGGANSACTTSHQYNSLLQA